MLIQLISSIVFVSITREEGIFDEYGNLIKVNDDPDKIQTTEAIEKKSDDDAKKQNALFNFICRRKRFKKGVKYLPAFSYFLQVVLLLITIFSPRDAWWPSLL